jgi:hypothetical protein
MHTLSAFPLLPTQTHFGLFSHHSAHPLLLLQVSGGGICLHIYFFTFYLINAINVSVAVKLILLLLLQLMMVMPMGWDYISELQPPTGLLFIPQLIYEHGKPWWNDIGRGNSWFVHHGNPTSSHLVPMQEEMGAGNDEFDTTKYLCSYFRHFNML